MYVPFFFPVRSYAQNLHLNMHPLPNSIGKLSLSNILKLSSLQSVDILFTFGSLKEEEVIILDIKLLFLVA